MDKLSLEQDPEAYWEYQFMIQRVQLNFVLDQFTKTLEVPDMSELAQSATPPRKTNTPWCRKPGYPAISCSVAWQAPVIASLCEPRRLKCWRNCARGCELRKW